MSLATLFGYFAGLLTTIALVPQVVKTWKTKSADDFSLWMLLIWWTGLMCWVVYGVLTHAHPIIVWNMCTLIFAGAILAMKLKFKNKTKEATIQVLRKKSEAQVFQDWGV